MSEPENLRVQNPPIDERYDQSGAGVVIPHVTESSSSSEKSIPSCIVKNFPNAFEHTLQWARDEFVKEFHDDAEIASQYLTDLKFMGETLKLQGSLPLDILKTLKRIVVDERPKTFEDCVRLARHMFAKNYTNRIKQLLFNFPPDQKTSTGAPFWSGPKRCPTSIEFDSSKEQHLDFIESVAHLKAAVYGIPQVRDRQRIKSIVDKIVVEEFVPKAEVTEAEAASSSNNIETPASEDLINLLKSLPSPSSLSDLKITPLEFEKEDDTNFHMNFMVAASNLRANNYSIPEADRHKEPLIRQSTEGQVPDLLNQLLTSARCSCKSDALWVAVHALMLESGFISSESRDPAMMPGGYKCSHYYMCRYNYRVTADIMGSCSVVGITLGASVVVHGLTKSKRDFKTDHLTLKSADFVPTFCHEGLASYNRLDSLSRQVKDTICHPLIEEIYTAAVETVSGYPEKRLQAWPCELTPTSVKNGTTANIFVTHVTSPSDLHLVCTGEEHGYYLTMHDEMQQMYGKDLCNIYSLFYPYADMVCAAKLDDDEWHRAKVMSSATDKQVTVSFVDLGKTQTIHYDHLKKLHRSFIKLPIQAIPCRLVDICPTAGPASEWSDEAKLWCRDNLTDATGRARFIRSGQETQVVLWLENCANVPQTESINSALVEFGLAQSTSSDYHPKRGQSEEVTAVSSLTKKLNKLNESPVSTSTETSKTAGSRGQKVSKVQKSAEEKHRIQQEILKAMSTDGSPTFRESETVYIEVVMCNYVSPSEFYVQVLGSQEDLMKLMKNMQDTFDKSEPPPPRSWSVNEYCAAKYSLDGRWYRGNVMSKVSDEKYEVEYVDFGNVDIVEVSNLRALPPEYGSRMPCAAARCHLADLQPAGSVEINKWSQTAIEFMASLLKNRKLYMKQEGDLTRMGLPVDLIMEEEITETAFEPSRRTYHSVRSEIIQNGLAMHSKKQPVPPSQDSPGINPFQRLIFEMASPNLEKQGEDILKEEHVCPPNDEDVIHPFAFLLNDVFAVHSSHEISSTDTLNDLIGTGVLPAKSTQQCLINRIKEHAERFFVVKPGSVVVRTSEAVLLDREHGTKRARNDHASESQTEVTPEKVPRMD